MTLGLLYSNVFWWSFSSLFEMPLTKSNLYYCLSLAFVSRIWLCFFLAPLFLCEFLFLACLLCLQIEWVFFGGFVLSYSKYANNHRGRKKQGHQKDHVLQLRNSCLSWLPVDEATKASSCLKVWCFDEFPEMAKLAAAVFGSVSQC